MREPQDSRIIWSFHFEFGIRRATWAKSGSQLVKPFWLSEITIAADLLTVKQCEIVLGKAQKIS